VRNCVHHLIKIATTRAETGYLCQRKSGPDLESVSDPNYLQNLMGTFLYKDIFVIKLS